MPAALGVVSSPIGYALAVFLGKARKVIGLHFYKLGRVFPLPAGQLSVSRPVGVKKAEDETTDKRRLPFQSDTVDVFFEAFHRKFFEHLLRLDVLVLARVFDLDDPTRAIFFGRLS